MSVNDREVLVQLFNESKANDAPNQTDSDFFETYVPYHFLKGHELDFTDIEGESSTAQVMGESIPSTRSPTAD